MKSVFSVFIAAMLIQSCNNKKTEESLVSSKQQLMDTDRAFSKLSEEKGMKSAFIEYIDSNGVLLRPYYMPIVGANAIDYLIQMSDTGYTLTWEPFNGAVAKSGDMGYTYGVYTMRPNSKDTSIYGTYTSIWRKETSGRWKFVLDTGNEGVGINASPD